MGWLGTPGPEQALAGEEKWPDSAETTFPPVPPPHPVVESVGPGSRTYGCVISAKLLNCVGLLLLTCKMGQPLVAGDWAEA